MTYAHSLEDTTTDQWEKLSEHLSNVALLAATFAAPFGFAQMARAAGQLHDIGKASAAFQAYIASPPAAPKQRVDHSTAGACEADNAYPKPLGRILAVAIAGHHAGLMDGARLDDRLRRPIEPYPHWQTHSGTLPSLSALKPTGSFQQGPLAGFTLAFLGRMLFSCLVDADFLSTEAFYARATNQPIERGHHTELSVLRDRLWHFMATKPTEGPVNALRRRVLDHAIAKAVLDPGLFTLTVPTGGGKTLASLSFALEHAGHHRHINRVVFVVPFTSIIEQTAQVFREALDTQDDILEHHASFDWERAAAKSPSDDEGRSGLAKLRRAAENWDAPIIVTTAVQFFESLFAARTARCRKLHNLAGAVIVLDEAQTLPLPLLRPCMAALEELACNYGASVVLCTATQPALLKRDHFVGGLDIPVERELAPDPDALYTELKRVDIEVMADPVTDGEIAARFAEQPRMLCIVNSRGHARTIYDTIRDLPGATYLTTLMCPRHRRAVLADVRARLLANEPVRLVATSLIEAGVDVDFPEVWRAAAGLDSIAQAAGRCNREGRLARGRVVVFVPAEAKPPRALAEVWQAARPVLRRHSDVLGRDAIRDYFQELYWQKGREALDAALVDGRPGVLPAIAERATTGAFPYRSIADAFRLIDDVMATVIVPWDDDARALLAAIAAADRPGSDQLRRLQQYAVAIPHADRDAWLMAGALTKVHPAMGNDLLTFAADNPHYRQETGLDLSDIGQRGAENNVMS